MCKSISNRHSNDQRGTNTKKINLFTGTDIFVVESYCRPHLPRYTLKIQSGADQKGAFLHEISQESWEIYTIQQDRTITLLTCSYYLCHNSTVFTAPTTTSIPILLLLLLTVLYGSFLLTSYLPCLLLLWLLLPLHCC